MNEHTKAKQRQYRIDHKDELAAKKKIYYEKKRDHIVEYQRQYRDEHKDMISLRAQEYYQTHREVMDARTKARTQPKVLHRRMIKEFKSKHLPWNEDVVPLCIKSISR